MTLPRYELMFSPAASSWGLKIDAGAFVYLAEEDFFWSSIATGGTASLRAALQTLLGSIGGTTVTINATTGIMTITWGAGSHTLTFSGTLADRCGFATSVVGPSTVLTGTRQVQGLWLPNVMPGELKAPLAGRGSRTRSRKITRSRGGQVWTRTHGDSMGDAHWRFRGLSAAKTWKESEARRNESFESFWELEASGSAKGAIRYYRDASDATSYLTATYSEARDFVLADPIASDFAPTPVQASYDGVWDLAIDAHEFF